jgi:hypothetical protein
VVDHQDGGAAGRQILQAGDARIVNARQEAPADVGDHPAQHAPHRLMLRVVVAVELRLFLAEAELFGNG